MYEYSKEKKSDKLQRKKFQTDFILLCNMKCQESIEQRLWWFELWIQHFLTYVFIFGRQEKVFFTNARFLRILSWSGKKISAQSTPENWELYQNKGTKNGEANYYLESSPHSPQLEKKPLQQQRPSTAKNK